MDKERIASVPEQVLPIDGEAVCVKRNAVQAPNMPEIFVASGSLYTQYQAMENEIRRQVDDFSRNLYEEHRDKLDLALEAWRQASREANEQARQSALAFAAAAYNGDFGQGTLVVLGQDEFSKPKGEPFYRLARVLDCTPEQRYAAELEKTGWMYLDCAHGALMADRYIDFLSHLRPEFGILDPSCSGSVEEWEARLVEVNVGQLTEEELGKLYTKMKQWDKQEDYYLYPGRSAPKTMSPSEQIRLFGSLAKFEPGDTYWVAGCSHHSGDTDASLVYLPTGRWAVIASYSGDYPSRTWCAGIVSDPNTTIDTSGKYSECYIRGKTERPTPEEETFLQKWNKDQRENDNE